MATTSSAVQFQATSMASASRVDSSTMLRSFSLLRLAVSSNWEAYRPAASWLARRRPA
jgi:hypothetical protein